MELTDKVRTIARSMITASHENMLDDETFDNYLQEILLKAQETEKCLICVGNGWVLDLYQKQYTCPKCNGTGLLKVKRPDREKIAEWLYNWYARTLMNPVGWTILEDKLKENYREYADQIIALIDEKEGE